MSLRTIVRSAAIAALLAVPAAGPALADGWHHDRGWGGGGWRDHHEWRRDHEWRGYGYQPGYYAPPPVVMAPPQAAYVPPPVVVAPPVAPGFNLVLPINIR